MSLLLSLAALPVQCAVNHSYHGFLRQGTAQKLVDQPGMISRPVENLIVADIERVDVGLAVQPILHLLNMSAEK